MKREDWLLLVLAAADGEVMTFTRILKCIFLVSNGLSIEGARPEFEPGPYGPFCRTLGADLDLLEQRGYVFTLHRDRQTMYAASVAGWKRADTLPISESTHQHARRVVAWAQSQEFNTLWREMKKSHPEMCTQ